MSSKPFALLLALVVISASGCQLSKFSKNDLGNLNPLKRLGESKAATQVEEFQDPVRMAVIWTDGVYDSVGSDPVRGFGARIYFYNTEGEAIRADGDLAIYGYDDTVKKESYEADRKFVFERSRFQTHFSETGIGPSYSVWVPWDKKGGIRKTVSLVPIFSTATGKQIKGGHSVNVLSGVDPETDETISNGIEIRNEVSNATITRDESKIVQASGYQEVDSSGTDSGGDETPKIARRRATTIKLNRSMVRRMGAGGTGFPKVEDAQRESVAPMTYRDSQQITQFGQTSPVQTETPKRVPDSFKRVFGRPGAN